jgi:hypothetical protein
MTDQKWPVLLMCRDSISEGFFHTPRPSATPSHDLARSGEGCSGLQSERLSDWVALQNHSTTHERVEGGPGWSRTGNC